MPLAEDELNNTVSRINDDKLLPTQDSTEFVARVVLGDHMTLGDFCRPMRPTASSTLDKQSNHYLAHHNLAALCWGIALANRVFDADNINHHHTIALSVGAAVEAIENVIKSQQMADIARYKFTFEQLRHGRALDSGDDDRAVLAGL